MYHENVNVKIKTNIVSAKKIICGILLHVVNIKYTNSKYVGSIIDDSVITCDETIEETKAISISFSEKR